MAKIIKLTESELKKMISELYDDDFIKRNYENELSDEIGNCVDFLIKTHTTLIAVVEKDLNQERRKQLNIISNALVRIIDELQDIAPEALPPRGTFKEKE